MASKKYKEIKKILFNSDDVFMGYQHRRHRTRPKKTSNNKKNILNRIIDKEHKNIISSLYG